MGLIEKFEAFINKILIFIGDLITSAYLKVTPVLLQKFFGKLKILIVWLKNAPALFIKNLPAIIATVKSFAASFNFKEALKETHKQAMAQYAHTQKAASSSDFKKLFLIPYLMVNQWLKGLSFTQGSVLICFTVASFFSGAGMVWTGNKLVETYKKSNRAPASVEEEISYDRPNYYKKQARHLEITNLRLPVYFSNVNELRTVDVDFTTTLSNRMARMKLEKLEFQLRDHLITHVEPMVADFPLLDEGKMILKEKLQREMNDFMINNKIEGEVKDLKLTYILAN